MENCTDETKKIVSAPLLYGILPDVLTIKLMSYRKRELLAPIHPLVTKG